MKSIIIRSICVVLCGLFLIGCKSVEKTEKYTDPFVGKIIESSDVVCEKPMEQGIYFEKKQWDEAVQNTDVETVRDMQMVYDENFFEQYSLCYVVEIASGNSKYELVDYTVVEENGEMILKISYTYSEKAILNKQYSYDFFLPIDKEVAGSISKIQLDGSCRD